MATFETHAIYADGVCLVNAVDYSNFEEEPAQLIVCEVCANVGCNSGNWVFMRRLGNAIVMIPAYSKLCEFGDDSWYFTHYAPPDSLLSRGIPVIGLDDYRRARGLVTALPDLEGIRQLNAAEAIWLTQWTTPLNVLGRFPAPPRLKRGAVIAVADGEVDEEIANLKKFIERHFKSEEPLCELDHAGAVPVEFFLDGPSFPAWSPISHVHDGLAFRFEPGDQIVTLAPCPQ